MARKILEDNASNEYFKDLIAGIRHEISENLDVQIEVLDNIRKNQAKL